MVHFKLGSKKRKMQCSSCHERGKNKKYEFPTGVNLSTAKGIEREGPPGVWEVVGSIPVRDSAFFFVLLS